VEVPSDPLTVARARLDDTLATLSEGSNEPAMMLAARNAIMALGGMARFHAQAGDLAFAVARTGEAVRRFLDRDPGEDLCYPLLDARAAALSDVVREHGDLGGLGAEIQADWVQEAFEIFAARDAADAWLLGAAALLRWFPAGEHRKHLERARERAVAAIARFDRALEPALGGLSPLRDAAHEALERARTDEGYARRAQYWVRVLQG
jgi:hypothetical protein